MPTATLTHDGAYTAPGGPWDDTGYTAPVGGAANVGLFRFALDAVAGQSLPSATLKVWSSSRQLIYGQLFSVRIDDVADSPWPAGASGAAKAADANGRTWFGTTPPTQTEFVAGYDVVLSQCDVTALLQRIVDFPGWVSGGHVLLSVGDAGAATWGVKTAENAAVFGDFPAPEIVFAGVTGGGGTGDVPGGSTSFWMLDEEDLL